MARTKKSDKIQLVESSVYFEPLCHSYLSPEGEILTGVTTLLKEYGLQPEEYAYIDPAVLAKAAERGTAIHELLESYDNGKKVKETPELVAYKEMIKQVGHKVIRSEYLVSNDVVASMIDKVLDDYSIADVKTSSNPHHETYRWQLSIYKYLFEQQNPKLKVPHLYVYHVRDGKANCIEVQPIAEGEIERLIDCKRKGVESFVPTLEEGEVSEELSNVLPVAEQMELVRTERSLVRLKETMKRLEEVRQGIYDKLTSYMSNGIQRLDFGGFAISYVKGYERVSVDSAKLKEELPDIAAKYSKITHTKASVRITIKN